MSATIAITIEVSHQLPKVFQYIGMMMSAKASSLCLLLITILHSSKAIPLGTRIYYYIFGVGIYIILFFKLQFPVNMSIA